MTIFRNPRVARVLRPVATTLALAAAVWHGSHAATTWRQSTEFRTSEPALSRFLWDAFQTEAAVTVASLVAAFMAWALFKPRTPQVGPPEPRE